MQQTRLDETAEYSARREELRLAEVELMRQREKVAALRRHLPRGAVVEDYGIPEGPRALADGDDPSPRCDCSTVSVFVLDPEGRPRHSYSCHPRMADDIQQRGIDLLSPVWHLLDLTPQGRGEWFAGLDY